MFGRASAALAIAAALTVAVAAATAPASQSAPPTRHLNVLLVVVDDLNVHLGTYGGPIQTPNIDRLAALGRRFDAAYNQFPICNPSRASFMSGWRPQRTRVLNQSDSAGERLKDAPTLEKVFRQAGYHTARFGKIYHFDSEFQWDVAIDQLPDPDPIDDKTGQPLRRHKIRFEEKWEATSLSEAELADGATARRVAELLGTSQERPFFVAVGFVRPHGPWIAPKRYFDLYPPSSAPAFTRAPDDLDDVPLIATASGAEPRIRDNERGQAWAAYAACTTFMDAQLGLILTALDRKELWRNTVVVLASDNGIHRGEHGLWRKNTLFEESARIPLIIVAPGVADPGKPTAQLVELTDLHPTLLELAGLPPAAGTDGTSLTPLLRDPTKPVRRAAFTVTERDGKLAFSVRTDRYRLNLWPDGSSELYDHQADPGEIRNLVKDASLAPTLAPIVAELKRLLAEPGTAIVGRR
jgi:uncharacterized sulfatase